MCYRGYYAVLFGIYKVNTKTLLKGMVQQKNKTNCHHLLTHGLSGNTKEYLAECPCCSFPYNTSVHASHSLYKSGHSAKYLFCLKTT